MRFFFYNSTIYFLKDENTRPHLLQDWIPAYLLLRQQYMSKPSFPRKRESKTGLDAGSSPAWQWICLLAGVMTRMTICLLQKGFRRLHDDKISCRAFACFNPEERINDRWNIKYVHYWRHLLLSDSWFRIEVRITGRTEASDSEAEFERPLPKSWDGAIDPWPFFDFLVSRLSMRE